MIDPEQVIYYNIDERSQLLKSLLRNITLQLGKNVLTFADTGYNMWKKGIVQKFDTTLSYN